MDILKNCTLCPRKCGVDRTLGVGFCKAPKEPKLARAALHFWEEPSISGTRGSGTVFFSGCNLKCVYCQNFKISTSGFGKEVSIDRLSEIFIELQNKGAHNINLVSPTPYLPQIISAIDRVRNIIKIPFVYNTGGYESLSTLELLKDYIDIFLTDIKYKDCVLSQKYSSAKDYFEVSLAAAKKMIELCGEPKFDKDGILQSGVIVRHLVLPTCRHDSIAILKEIKKNLPEDKFLLSIMSQYTPNENIPEEFNELKRKITSFEYNSVVDTAIDLGLSNGYMQDLQSFGQKYTPPFDLSGI